MDEEEIMTINKKKVKNEKDKSKKKKKDEKEQKEKKKEKELKNKEQKEKKEESNLIEEDNEKKEENKEDKNSKKEKEKKSNKKEKKPKKQPQIKRHYKEPPPEWDGEYNYRMSESESENENLKNKKDEEEKEIELINSNLSISEISKKEEKKNILSEEEEEETSEDDENIQFKYNEYITRECCTSHYFGYEKINQQCYFCTSCNPEKNNKLCKYCYDNCHKKCRRKLEIIRPELVKVEKLENQKFFCFCGTNLKHIPNKIKIKNLIPCLMMNIDKELSVDIFFCHNHGIVICGICSSLCHKNCKVELKDNISDNENFKCHCYSEKHTSYNEIVFNFSLEDYIKKTKARVWFVQILNILFKKNTFDKMRKLFINGLNNNIVSKNGNLFNRKFYKMIEIFSTSFNRKFKTFYYHPDMESMFDYDKTINFIKKLEINNSENVLTKLRLLYIILYLHLRKDYQVLKSLTSIDFMSSTVIDRLNFKKMLMCENKYTEYIEEKYQINKGNFIKKFMLDNICQLFTKGIEYINVEENINEFLKAITILSFLLKRMMYTKEDLELLINNLYNFHSVYFDYLIKDKNNIYYSIDLFSSFVELCFMLSVNLNDLVIEEYLDKKGPKKFNKGEIKDFVQTKSEHGAKLFCMILRNCQIMSKHFKLISKPGIDNENEEEKKKEILKLKHKSLIKEKIINNDSIKLKTRIPKNEGLFLEKIIFLYNESLSMFCLANNNYYQNLDNLTKDDILSYYKFCEDIKTKEFYDMTLMTRKKIDSNILYHLKVALESIYHGLFTSTYMNQDKIDQKMQTRILNAIDLINESLNMLMNIRKFYKMYEKFNEKKKAKSKSKVLDEEDKDIELLKKRNYRLKIINQIKNRIIFLKHPLIELDEIVELLVNNFIASQIDETIMKGIYFLTNINFPNLLNEKVFSIIFEFLSVYLLTKKGVEYFLTGKNLQRLRKCLSRFSFKKDQSNINEGLGRIEEFNTKCMTIVIHFFNELVTASKIYKIKTIANHKIIPKIKLCLLDHLKNFIPFIQNDEESIDFKIQFSEIIPIYNNLYPYFTYDDFEDIKSGLIDIFFTAPTNLKEGDNFCRWFGNNLNLNLEEIAEARELELNIYFSFFEIISKNTFYCYNNDKEMQNRIQQIFDFMLLEDYVYLFQSSNLFSIKQKEIIMRFIRNLFLIDFLDPIDYSKMKHFLKNDEYRDMIYDGLIEDENITQYITKNEKKNFSSSKKKILLNKYEFVSKISFIFKIYVIELNKFPRFIIGEKLEYILSYIHELVFGIQSLANLLYLQKRIINKIIPDFYLLVKLFLKKKKGIIDVLLDINNTGTYNPDYLKENLTKDPYLNEIESSDFNVYDKDILCKLVMEGCNEIFKLTNMDEEYNLQSYLKFYDKMVEANFTPCSLLETRDYEYFYEEDDFNHIKLLMKDPSNYKIIRIKKEFNKQFTRVSTTIFYNVIRGVYTEHKMDYGEMLANFFKYFLNSIDSSHTIKYRKLLCIMTKILFYNTKEMQSKFEGMVYDNNFFANLNRLLNLNIVLNINCSKNYTLIKHSEELADITKLTIQFLQLLGEEFNTFYHYNILTNKVKKNFIEEDSEIDNEEYEELNQLKTEESLIDNSSINEKSKKSKSKKSKKSKKDKDIPPQSIMINRSIYESITLNLMRVYNLMDLKNPIETEMPFDKLCILTSNFIDFIIEFIHTQKQFRDIIDENIVKLIFGTGKIINDYDNPYDYIDNKGVIDIFQLNLEDNYIYKKNYETRNLMICFIKKKYYQLIYNYLLIGQKEFMVQLLINKGNGPVELFKEILKNMRNLIKRIINIEPKKYSYIAKINNSFTFYSELIKLYNDEFLFNSAIEIDLILNIYLVLKIFEENYKIQTLRSHFELMEFIFLYGDIIKATNLIIEEDEEEQIKKIPIRSEIFQQTVFKDMRENPYQKIYKNYYKLLQEEKRRELNKNNSNELLHFLPIHSKFALGMFLFLENIVLKVEIGRDVYENDNLNKININHFSSKVAEKINNERTKMNKDNKKEKEENKEKVIIENIIKENKNTAFSFFIKQSFTFHLSKYSKNYFLNNVDRTNASTKYNNLISYSDYFIFEMLYNSHCIGENPILKTISEIDLYYAELINFIFILLNNIILMNHFYLSPKLPVNLYFYKDESLDDKLYNDNKLILFIHLIYIFLIIIYWIYFRFLLNFEKNLMLTCDKSFVFRKQGVIDQNILNPIIIDSFKGEVGIFKVMGVINKNIGIFKYLYILIIKSIFLNPEICFFIFCLILNLLYYFLKSPILIAIEILFFANLIPILKDIIKSISYKFLTLIYILLFTYLIVYFFMWIAYYYINNLFYVDVMEYDSGEIINESFCSSPLQCLLYILSYGTRSRGGINEELPLMSYKNNISFFLQRFFYDLLFFIFVIMIMGNISFGIIIDTFNDLRDKKWYFENDKKNICFICQLSRDECLLNNINFERHIKLDHNIWNYVYFLTYLHLNNSNDFNVNENNVWDKLFQNDNSWIPIKKNEENEEN